LQFTNANIGAFVGLFNHFRIAAGHYNYSLRSAENLILPNNVVDNCYRGMFMRCTGFVEPPVLPATTLAANCYNRMFNGCSSLRTAPELPATTLVNSCYANMFVGSGLNYIKCLATDGINTTNLNNWVQYVGASGTFVKDANATWSTGASGIPKGWDIIDAVIN
jgi:hypothetical protein